MPSSVRGAMRRILRFQFGLRLLFGLTLLAAIWMCIIVHRASEARIAVGAIRQHSGRVYYTFQESPQGSGRYDLEAKSHLPQCLIAKLGEDFFYDVVVVRLSDGTKAETRGDIAASLQPPSHYLPALRGVRHLFYGESRINDNDLSFIGSLKDLETLEAFNATGVTDAGIDHLAASRRLRVIALLDSSVTDESLQTLAGLPLLERLELPGACITDRGLSYLRCARGLRQLGLGGGRGEITDRGMESIGALSALQYLDLSDANVTATGLKYLGWQPALRYLDLSNNRVLGDDAMSFIASFTGLEEVRLRNTNLTSKGVEALAKLRKLRILDISENPGIDERATAHLPKLAALTELDLHGTRVKFTKATAGNLASLRFLAFLDLAETGSSIRDVETMLPKCQVTGVSFVRASVATFDTGADFMSVVSEWQMWDVSRQASELKKFALNGEIAYDFIPSAEVLPPKNTLRRMVELTKIVGLGKEFAKQRKVLEQLENRVDPSWDGVSSRDDFAPTEHSRELFELAQSNESLERLYRAAIAFGLADSLFQHIERLDGLREEVGLTDIEQAEYQEASTDFEECLCEARKQLAIAASSPQSGPDDAITEIWKGTRRGR